MCMSSPSSTLWPESKTQHCVILSKLRVRFKRGVFVSGVRVCFNSGKAHVVRTASGPEFGEKESCLILWCVGEKGNHQKEESSKSLTRQETFFLGLGGVQMRAPLWFPTVWPTNVEPLPWLG